MLIYSSIHSLSLEFKPITDNVGVPLANTQSDNADKERIEDKKNKGKHGGSLTGRTEEIV